jgi:hypothetical protein
MCFESSGSVFGFGGIGWVFWVVVGGDDNVETMGSDAGGLDTDLGSCSESAAFSQLSGTSSGSFPVLPLSSML